MAPSSSNTQDNEKTVQSLNSQSNSGLDNNALVWQTLAEKAKNLKKGDKIEIKLDTPGDDWLETEIDGKYRKRKGDWYYCMLENKRKVINLGPGMFVWRKVGENHECSEVNDCLLLENEVHEVYAVKVPHNQHHLPHVIKAKKKEHDTIKEFNTYSEIREDKLSPSQEKNKQAGAELCQAQHRLC